MSYISGDISSLQELFETFDKMRELTVQSTSTTKLELAYDEVQHAITALNNEITEEDEEFLIHDEVIALHNLADAIKARIAFANKEAEDGSDDDYYDDLNDDSDYDEDDIDDLYIELKERNDMNQSSRDMQFESWLSYLINAISSNFQIDAQEVGFQTKDLISKLQDKIDNLEKVTEDTRKVDGSIKREREQALKKNTNPRERTSDLDSFSAYLAGGTDKLDKELENNLKQAADLLSSFEDHLRRR